MKAENSRAPDRRVMRTQRLLREALHSLIREKDYDAIVVKEILDRADVGRSAFYTHFRDKDDLLASSIQDLLASVPPAERSDRRIEGLLWFSLPLLQHVERHHAAGGFKVGPRGRAVLHGRLQKVLIEMIRAQIRKRTALWRDASGSIPAELLARYIASTFVLVLDWWVDSHSRLNAREANSLFQALVVPTLSAIAT